MKSNFHELEVVGRKSQTPDANVIYFDIPRGKERLFDFTAGQYITVEVEVRGQMERRAYSLCTAPSDEQFGICVKRLKGGKVSNFMLDRVVEGRLISVMPPDGRFTARPNPDQRRTFYLIGAGSGITPLMSIARSILEEEPGSSVHLLYGNRSEDTIIFREELAEMEKRYSGQFTVRHILSQPKQHRLSGIKGLLGKKKVEWTGRIGRVDAQELRAFLADYPARTKTSEYYICGPAGMIDTAEITLLRDGIDDEHIHTERFFTPAAETEERIQGVSDNTVRVTLDGAVHELTVPSDKTILEALVEQGQNPPYSCTSGACSTCIAKVNKGEVKMDVNHALDPDEVEEGYVLTCQAHPVTEEVELSFDD